MFLLGEIRKQNHYTQDALSKRLGVSRSTVSMWENEESQPDNTMLCRLADLFGLPIDAFFGREIHFLQPSEEEQKLLSLFSSADERSRKIALYTLSLGQPAAHSLCSVPYYSLSALAHANTAPGKTLVLRKAPPENTSYITQVEDLSMSPTYQPGDYLFIKYQPNVNYGDIGVFTIGGQVVIRKMMKNELSPINPDFESINLKKCGELFCHGIILQICTPSYLSE